MIIGVPKEIKTAERRIALPPSGAKTLVSNGHRVLIETRGGLGSAFSDDDFIDAGAEIIPSARAIWGQAEMIIKVKEPLASEWELIKPGQVLFTFFHFASSRELTLGVLDTGCVAVAYETVTDDKGRLPLLEPMSEVAGRLAVQEGAKYLEAPMGGRGVMLGGVPGVLPGEVVILGGGTVGINAAKMAAGLGAHVTMLDIDINRLRYLDDVMPSNVDTLFSNESNIREALCKADLVVGAVLIHGAEAPRLVTRDMISLMKRGAMIVDVAIDQGGCVETITEHGPTDHKNPTFVVDGVLHYAVANMPGAVPLTSTLALTNATIPFAVKLANKGYRQAALDDPGIMDGINMIDGKVTCQAVAELFDLPYTPVEQALGI